MVSVYRRKRIKKYSSKDADNAVSKILKNEISLNAASNIYKIPKTTLHRLLSAKRKGSTVRKHGHPTVLTQEEEGLLARALVYLADCGHPLDRRTLKVRYY